MGNRAIVIFADKYNISPAIYLHWNGGAESIYPFLEELEKRGGGDMEYAPARFIQVVGDLFDCDERNTQSVGVSNGPAEIELYALRKFDPGDNGIYVIESFYKDYEMQQRIRRFTSHGKGDSRILREWTDEEVERERISALKSKYNEGIRATFREIDRKLYEPKNEQIEGVPVNA